METAALLLIVATVTAWLIAEARAGRAVRIILGLTSLAGCGVAAYALAKVGPSYERHLHMACMRELGDLAAQGDWDRIQQGLSAYNDVTAQNPRSTFTAASKMWKVVNPPRTTSGADLLFGPLKDLPTFNLTIIPADYQPAVGSISISCYGSEGGELRVVRTGGETTTKPLSGEQLERFYLAATKAVRDFRAKPPRFGEKAEMFSVNCDAIPLSASLTLTRAAVAENKRLQVLFAALNAQMPNDLQLP